MRDMQKNFSLMIAPSYRCNANCQYCYTKGYISKFKKDMDLLTFIGLVEAHQKHENLNLSIIGGEPTIWKHINNALLYCRLRKVKATVFSNGLEKLRIMPSRMYLNSSQYFEKNRREKFIESLEFYSKKKVKTVLRYNVEGNCSDDKLDELIALAVEYEAGIHLALVVPYTIDKALGKRIFEMLQKVVAAGIVCRSANPIPPCMFDAVQLEWMRKNVGYYSACDLGSIPLINPDGKTVQPCSKMFLFKEMKKDGLSKNEIKLMYQKEMETIKNKLPMEKCYQCEHFINEECFGGCMASRANEFYGCG